MAAEAVASTSSTGVTASPASVSSCWNPLSVQAAFDIAVYNLYYGNHYHQNYHQFYADPLNLAQAASASASQHYTDAANSAVSRPKRRKVEGSNPVQEQTVFDARNGRARGVTYKPYIGLNNNSLASGGRLTRKGEDLRPLKTLKRKNGEHANHAGALTNVNVKNTHALVQHERGCTIGNLFPEILSMVFEYLDVKSKGRVAQVRESILPDNQYPFMKTLCKNEF